MLCTKSDFLSCVMQGKVSAEQPLSVLMQPPPSKSGLGYFCFFAIVNVSPHVTGKPKLFLSSSKFFIGDFF